MCDKNYYEIGIWFLSIGTTLILSSISIGSTIYYSQPVLPTVTAKPISEIKLKF